MDGVDGVDEVDGMDEVDGVDEDADVNMAVERLPFFLRRPDGFDRVRGRGL